MDAAARKTSAADAYGEGVWSRSPDAGIKSCGDSDVGPIGPDTLDPQGDGGKKARLTEESTQ
jgi:hypothetical protein